MVQTILVYIIGVIAFAFVGIKIRDTIKCASNKSACDSCPNCCSAKITKNSPKNLLVIKKGLTLHPKIKRYPDRVDR